jgi:hypothetical protein
VSDVGEYKTLQAELHTYGCLTLDARLEQDDGEGQPAYRAWVERQQEKRRVSALFSQLRTETA